MKTGFMSAPISKIPIFRASLCWLVIAIALTSGPTLLCAGYELSSRESTGYGDNENSAVTAALIEAVRQFQGLTIESEKVLRLSLVESDSKRDLTSRLEDNVRSRTKGQIHSYEVLSVNQADGRWVAHLRVALPEYRSPGPDRSMLRAISVMPFRSRVTELDAGGPGVVRRWSARLVSHLVQSRRFRVLDRDYREEQSSEEVILRSGETPVSELVKVGQKIGADYVMVGDILNFEAGSDAAAESTFVVEYRVIEPALGEVRWANQASVRLSRSASERMGLQNRSLLTEYLLNAVADSVVTELLDLIYPIKVLDVDSDGTIVLNEGGNRTPIGQWFSIFSGGKTVPDPDSGRPVPIDGREIGIVSIQEAQGKFARARLESGTAGSITKGMVCRRFSAERLAELQSKDRERYERTQQTLIASGECPNLIIRAFRTGAIWQISVKNRSQKAIRLDSLSKRLAGTSPETTPFYKTIAPGQDESFGLPYDFNTGDALDLICDGFSQRFTFFFP